MSNVNKANAAESEIDSKIIEKIFEVKNLSVVYDMQSDTGEKLQLTAVNGVSFKLYPGEILGVVGESGCGKSTLAKAILNLAPIKSGEVIFEGKNIQSFNQEEDFRFRSKAQIVFQDPFSSLNPRKRVGHIVGKPLKVHQKNYIPEKGIEATVKDLLEEVGLQLEHAKRFPHQFSGGQRQRIGIARALALKPEVLICDEAVSALDVSVQAQILNLLLDIKEDRNLSYLFISHDLSVVEFISTRILVMYLGNIVESAKTEDLMKKPLHPYTEALLSAFPVADPSNRLDHAPLTGDVPSPINPPSGCPFHTRCPKAMEKCSEHKPALVEVKAGQKVACFLEHDEVESE
jgi:oligopeptide/dipeptide ABC transporter ATP-binding protein